MPLGQCYYNCGSCGIFIYYSIVDNDSYIHTYIHAVQVAPIIEKVTKQGLWSRTILLVLVQAST